MKVHLLYNPLYLQLWYHPKILGQFNRWAMQRGCITTRRGASLQRRVEIREGDWRKEKGMA